MTSRLVSDATSMTVLLLAHRSTLLDQADTDSVIACVLDERWSEALDLVRPYDVLDGISPGELLAALDEANEEAARTHDKRERSLDRYILTHPDAKVDAVVDAKDPTLVHVTISAPRPRIFHAVIDVPPKDPTPYVDDAPEPAKRQEHDPDRRWACPKCTSVYATERIAGILAARGERYAHVVRCLCGEVRP